MKKNRSIFAVLAILGMLVESMPATAGGVKLSTEMTGGPLGSIADATCNATTSIIVPADSNQQCATMTVAGNPARIGDANCGATQCATYAVGEHVTICTTSPIYCYSASGATISISKIEQ